MSDADGGGPDTRPPIHDLEGLRVLDLTRLLPGALVTLWFADRGAEVIKIEQPPLGDYARYGFDGSEANPIFGFTNRGKKSVLLDLKSADGNAGFHRLAREADVVVEGFRPGVMDRLGIGYAALERENPRIVFASLTGYGNDGPYAQLAGHDINYLALAGVLDLIGAAGGTPVVPGIQIADIAGGTQQVVIEVLLALEARHRTGRGRHIEVSMFHGSMQLMAMAQSAFEADGRIPERGRELLSGGFACYNVYPAAEGSFVAVGALEPKFWENLCRELGCEGLIEMQFAEGQAEIMAGLAAKFAAQTAEEWFRRLGAKDCCVTPVRNLKDAIADYPQPANRKPAPRLGEHNAELLGA